MEHDYRVIRKVQKFNKNTLITYQIHEATYNANGKVIFITEDPIYPCGENIEEVMTNWFCLIEAFSKPILDYDNIPEDGAENEFDKLFEEIENVDNTLLDKKYKTLDEFMKTHGMTKEKLENIRARESENRKVKELQFAREFVNKPIEKILEKIKELTRGWF